MKSHFILIPLLVFSTSACKVDNHSDQQNPPAATALDQSLVTTRFSYFLNYEVDSLAFPRSMEDDLTVRGVPSKDWTSGFFPGSLVQIYEQTDDIRYLEKAQEWIPYIKKEQNNARTHDMGFKVMCSVGNVYGYDEKTAYADIILQSARTLIRRYDPEVGCIKSWDFGKDKWTFPVIIDNMMNLELLFKATELSGDSSFYKIADSHAKKTMENHFRPNFSSYHVIDYNPETGEVANKLTHQGLNAESSWARGQAWGLYGFTMCYRFTKNEEYLGLAQKIADFLIDHENMPEDYIPYWDLNDPAIPQAPRDASAGAVIASGLAELSTYNVTNSTQYKSISKQIVHTLSSLEYLVDKNVNVPFLLTNSVGNMPKKDELNAPISYADYYFLEAANRLEIKL